MNRILHSFDMTFMTLTEGSFHNLYDMTTHGRSSMFLILLRISANLHLVDSSFLINWNRPFVILRGCMICFILVI